ncbi:MAG: cell division protein FtsZ [Deltaproteobacteria bacterium]|nr:cell division protein FtsZ [Deltaproteobacteria bacterium]
MANDRDRRGEDRPLGKLGGGLDLLEVGPEDRADDDLLEFEDAGELKAKIRVIGVGGAGGNALDTMIRCGLAGVEFIAANTDAQALTHKLAPTKVQLGTQVTRGLGCGANPERGRAAAIEDRDKLRDLLIGSDMVFVTAGMGGGTGTGAAPVIAEIAREVGALTVAVVTKPFPFEGKQRGRHADKGLEELHRVCDTLITIPNHRLLALAGKDTRMQESFRIADDVLLGAVKGISDLITVHGLINLDFADVRTIMNEMGQALMGTGIGVGESRAKDAAYAAISSPLLEDVSIDGARGVLINITGGTDMTLWEVNEASTLIQEAAHEDANIIFGAVIDENMKPGEIRVTVIATGLEGERKLVAPDRGAATARPAPPSESVYVQPIRREAAPQPRAEKPVIAAPAPAPAPQTQRAAASVVQIHEPAQAPEFVSPFEDEYDVPAFLRKRRVAAAAGANASADDDELPAFLRKTAD